MGRVIKLKLDADSISDSIRELREYRESINKKVEELVRNLTMEGIEVAHTWIQTSQGDVPEVSVDYLINSAGDITSALIYMTGKDALFVEFGAGIHFNANEPPHAQQFGFGVGTYNPASDNAFDPNGWYYWTGTQRVHSYGIEGTYPMYHAAETSRNNAIKKAIEIFSRS